MNQNRCSVDMLLCINVTCSSLQNAVGWKTGFFYIGFYWIGFLICVTEEEP